MSYNRALGAAAQLSDLANKALEEGEKKYGSSDKHLEERDLKSRIEYTQKRINDYIEVIAKSEGDPAKLLADCENHLRFLFAKLKMEGKIADQNLGAPPSSHGCGCSH